MTKLFAKKITGRFPVLRKPGRTVLNTLSFLWKKIRFFSPYNLMYYSYPVTLPVCPGYVTRINSRGISGIAFGSDRTVPLKVELFVDNFVINTTWSSQKVSYPSLYDGEFIGFYFPMKDVWKHIDRDQKIEVKADGILLRYHAGKKGTGRYAIPYKNRKRENEKNIKDLIEAGLLINKFGRVRSRRDKNSSWEKKAFSKYEEINKVFEKEFGKSLYLFYGCLLGHAREGGIIAHDCDLDLAYFSEKTDPAEVRSEFFKITKRLIECGLDVIPVYYKILFEGGGLSVTPTWISDKGIFGSTFGYVGDGFSIKHSDVMPLKKALQGEYTVYLPNNPQKLAEYVYGRGWKYPDPGWKWLNEYKNYPDVLEARLSLRQIEKLNKELKSAADKYNND